MDKITWPTAEELDAMSHADLAELLVKHGVTEDELKGADLNSKDKRRAKVRELMAAGENSDKPNLAELAKDAKTIVFRTEMIDGARVSYALEPWPTHTIFAREFLLNDEATAGLMTVHEAGVDIEIASGKAVYCELGEVEDGRILYELQDGSTYVDPPLSQIDAIEDRLNGGEEQLDHIDTGRTEPTRHTFRQAIADEVRAAHARGDHSAHAALHNFEIAVGDFRRAAERVVNELPEDSELRDLARHIVEDL